MRQHDRLGHAVAVVGKQFERAAAIGLGAVATAAGLGHGAVAAVDWVGNLQDTTPRPLGRPACALFRAAGQPQRNRLVGGAEHSVHAPHAARQTRARAGGPTGRFGTGRTKVAACLSPLLLQDERPGAVSGPAATGA